MYRHEATEARIIKEARALGRALEHAGHDYEASQLAFGCSPRGPPRSANECAVLLTCSATDMQCQQAPGKFEWCFPCTNLMASVHLLASGGGQRIGNISPQQLNFPCLAGWRGFRRNVRLCIVPHGATASRHLQPQLPPPT